VPDVPHLIEVKAVTDTTAGFGDVFTYGDASQANVTVRAGNIKTLTVKPALTYLKGFLEFTCDPRGRKTTDIVACRPTIDGVPQADVAAGAKATYPLSPGEHIIHTDLAGDQASNWSPTSRDDMATISAGGTRAQTTKLKATFSLKGLLKVSVLPKGVMADLYVDTVLIAAQSASIEVYVSPGVAHTVEARAVTDPAANGVYAYGDVSRTVTVYAAGSRVVNLYPKKTWLLGFLKVTCQIKGKGASDDVNCVVSADGTQVGTVAVGKPGTFNLPPGDHAVVVTLGGAQASQWTGTVSQTITIVAERNVLQTVLFKRVPATPTLTPAINKPPAAQAAVSLPPGLVTFDFAPSIVNADRAVIAEGLASGYACLTKYNPSIAGMPLTVYVYDDLEAIAVAYAEHSGFGHSLDDSRNTWQSNPYPKGGLRSIFMVPALDPEWQKPNGGSKIQLMIHELLGVFIFELGGPNSANSPNDVPRTGPEWIFTATRTYTELVCAAEAGAVNFAESRNRYLNAAAGSLRGAETAAGDWQLRQTAQSGVQYKAGEFLAQHHGGIPALFAYFTDIGQGMAWPEAFKAAFGLTVEEFYAEFDVG
jgi:hypothetical protein